MSEHHKRDNVIRLAFAGSREAFAAFCRELEEFVPPGTTAIMRGSAVTGRRWRDDAPFDADGTGTSDLDVTLVGDGPLAYFVTTGFFVPGVHSRPLSDEDPDIAPDLVPLRTPDDPGEPAGQHPGLARYRHALPRRPVGPTVLTLFVKPDGLAISGPAAGG